MITTSHDQLEHSNTRSAFSLSVSNVRVVFVQHVERFESNEELSRSVAIVGQ